LVTEPDHRFCWAKITRKVLLATRPSSPCFCNSYAVETQHNFWEELYG
jgi:hypothetical protein